VNRSEKFWDRRAREYDRDERKYVQTYHKTIESTKRHLATSDIVLDYACGTGIITNEIAASVTEICAIDTSSKMIDVARRRAAERSLDNVHYTKATLFDRSYQRESFDVILAFNILHLLDDPQKVLPRIGELLTPGGLFISATPCLGEKKTFLGILLALLSRLGLVPYLKVLTISELEELVVCAGFRIVEAQDLDQTPPSYLIVAKRTWGTQPEHQLSGFCSSTRPGLGCHLFGPGNPGPAASARPQGTHSMHSNVWRTGSCQRADLLSAVWGALDIGRGPSTTGQVEDSDLVALSRDTGPFRGDTQCKQSRSSPPTVFRRTAMMRGSSDVAPFAGRNWP
jgi:2-polyprenyl-3-methyl-5-hydroxy-6-metoxy-1,4-benzoquinol methylase